MKKALFSILFLCLLFTLNAQINIAIEGGINLSKSQFKYHPDIFNPEFKASYYFKVIPKITLTNKLSLNVPLQYSEEGNKFPHPFEKPLFHKYHYLRLLPNLEYRFLNFLSVVGGIDCGWNTLERMKSNNSGWTKVSNFELIEDFDFGIQTGARAYLNDFFINLSYHHGLKDLNDSVFTDELGNPVSEIKQFSRRIQFGLGYIF